MKKLGEKTTVPMWLAKENCAFDNLMFIELISLKKLNQKLEEQKYDHWLLKYDIRVQNTQFVDKNESYIFHSLVKVL